MGSRIKGFQKSEQNDTDEALLKWLKQERSGNVPGSVPLLITSVLPKF
jgi:hypothetical protein